MIEIRNLIDGSRSGTPDHERRNPADGCDLVSLCVTSSPSDVSAAIAAAEAAASGWASLPPSARGKILMEAADLLHQRLDSVAVDLTREEGKTLAESRSEVLRTVDVLRYFGSEGWRSISDSGPGSTKDSFVFTRREPLGVVAVITPWNFPIAIPSWKIAPALLAGNTVVAKPAELTPLSMHHLVQSMVDAGLPKGVINVVHGSGRVVGKSILSDPRINGVSFTGSTIVGEQIQSILVGRGARVQLEMGGKNALVVLDDADASEAARIAAGGGFRGTGQACTATSRVICTEGIYSPFIEALAHEADRYRPGDGLREEVLMGPVVNEDQLNKNIAAVKKALDEGATVVTGRPGSEDLFFDPAVIVDIDPASPIMTEEIFGPVIGVVKAADLDSAIRMVNDSKYGLSAGICTNELSSAMRFAEEVQAGVVKVNQPTTGLDVNVPFGGVKASSTNTYREQGPTAIDFYTWTKTVYLGWKRG